jgi:hypothetical protein
MEEKLNMASRWLLALAVILIPLTVITIVSGAWGLNYQFNTNQWTRYLLFASWILLALSAIVGTANIISPPELESEMAASAVKSPASAMDEEEGEEEEEAGAGRPPRTKEKRPFNYAYAFTLTQACSFVLGMVLYVAYMSWMILGLQAYPTTGF